MNTLQCSVCVLATHCWAGAVNTSSRQIGLSASACALHGPSLHAQAFTGIRNCRADIRKDGGVARMSDPGMVTAIKQAVTIPVMAKARIGHFVEAQILEALDIDYIDESEVSWRAMLGSCWLCTCTRQPAVPERSHWWRQAAGMLLTDTQQASHLGIQAQEDDSPCLLWYGRC
jgi:SOR/SNZ family